MNPAWFLACAGLIGFCAVALGAFAAHGLKARLDSYALDIMQTATQYALVHAAVLVAVSCLPAGKAQMTAGITISLGVLVFSGSLYLLALSGIRTFGALTPVGGVLLLIGWASLCVAAWNQLKFIA